MFPWTPRWERPLFKWACSFWCAAGGILFFICSSSNAWAAPPQIDSIAPASGGSSPDQWVTLTAIYTDPDGWRNLKNARLLISTDKGQKAGACLLRYRIGSNTAFLRNDASTFWLGGATPGTAAILENSQARLDLAGTAVQGSGNRLTITWRVSFKPAFSGRTYNLYLKTKDDEATTGWVQTGTWTVDATAPTTPAVTDDGAATTDRTQLHATWTSSDAESGIAEYQYAIGTTAGGTDVVNWTSTGTDAFVTKTGLSLIDRATYYFSVEAKNEAGLWSGVGASDGILVSIPEGYTVSSVPFQWVETTAPTGITADDQAKEFILPFPVTFFGTTYSKVQVSSNGLLQFDSCNSCTNYSPDPIPNASLPNGIATVFWRDLDPSGGSITYFSDPTQFVVTWNNVLNYSGTNRQTFQVILKPDGSFIFQYSAVTHDVTTVIGLEHPDGTKGAAYPERPSNNTAIKFTSILPDPTPPTTPVVTDDGAFTGSTSQLHAVWTSSDAESGIAEYQYAIGTTTGGTNVVNWTSTGTTASVTDANLTLTNGTKYYVSVKARSGANVWSVVGVSDGITVDATPPATPVVTDDGVFTISTTQLHARWISSDPESGIAEYQYQITRDSAAGAVVIPWTSAGTEASVTQTGLTLTDGIKYFVSVRARNGAGDWSSIGSSDGIVVDPYAPVTPVVTDDGGFTASTTQLHASWTTSDPESGIAEYQYAIGTTAGGTDLVNWTSTGTTASVTKTGLTLTNGATYYFSVKAKNGAGTFSAVGVSDGIMVDAALISYTVSTASFNWIETTTPTGTTGDDQAKNFLLPFPVEFFGVSYSAVQVSSNGFLQFGPCDGCTSYRLQAIPNPSAPNRITAVFWRDLDPSKGGDITYLSEPTQFVVTWSRIPNHSSSDLQTFQAILRSDGSLILQYSAVTHNRTTVIGLENSDGSWGVAYTALPAANTAIMFTPVAVPDSTPPTVPVVTDDGIYSDQTTRLHATWRSEDPERPIVEYQYQIREDSPTGTVLVNWTSTGATASVTKTGLTLTNGATYYFSVKAKNSAGNWSSIGSSDGITVDSTVPTTPVVTDDGVATSSTTQLHASWISSDPESGIAEYQYAIGTTGGGTDLVNWTSTGTTASVTKTGLNLTNKETYYFSAKAKNGSGAWSVVGASDGIKILGTRINDNITTNTTWTLADSPYFVARAIQISGPSSPVLTIEPGVEVRFAASAVLNVGYSSNQGGIVAKGTASQPIVFTSNQAVKAAGDWQGIAFNDLTLDSSVLEHCVVEFAGGGTYRSSALYIESSSPEIRHCTIRGSSRDGILISSASPTIEDTMVDGVGQYGINLVGDKNAPLLRRLTVRNPVGYGVFVDPSGAGGVLAESVIANGIALINQMQVTGNTFTNYDTFPSRISADGVGEFLSGNILQGAVAGKSRLEVMNGAVSQSSTWPNNGMIYVALGSISIGGPSSPVLTIEPGVEVRFAASAVLNVGYSSNQGGIVAKGTASQPIVFTSNQAVKAAGDWQGIAFNDLALDSSVLEHCVVEFAGGGPYRSSALYIESSSPVIRHCTVRNSKMDGILLYNARPIIEHNTITGNGQGIVVSGALGLEQIRHNTITGNTSGGLVNNSGASVAAPLNWWGNVSGPSGIGPGIGDAVTGHVLFEPWLGQPPSEPFKWMEALNSPDPITQSGGWTSFVGALSEPGNWAVAIKDSANAVVKTFTGAGASFAQDWFGDDAKGVSLPNGLYTFQLDAVSQKTGQAAASAIGQMKLDNTLPVANITSPAPNQMLHSNAVVNILGTASGANFSSYTVEYGIGPAPAYWYQIASGTTPVANGLLAVWNTTDLTTPVYTIRLMVVGTGGQTASEQVTVRLLSFSNLSALPLYFSPNGDGVKDTTAVGVTATFSVNWALTIKSSAGATVKTFSGTGTTISQEWNGTDANGIRASDGVYTYQFQGTHTETTVTATSKTGQLTVDATPPTAIITSPAQRQIILTDDPLPFIGTASDTNFSFYELAYGVSASATSFANLTAVGSAVENGTLYTLDLHRLPFSQPELPPGTYTFRLTVQDEAGNVSLLDRIVVLDYIHITDVSVNPAVIDPYSAGVSNIQYTLSLPADATFRIYGDLSKQLVRTLTLGAQPAGANTVSWDGKNSAGAGSPFGIYHFTLEAIDGSGRKGTYNNAVAPLLAPLAIISNVEVNVADFNPYKNKPVAICYDLNRLARFSISFNPGVRTLLSNVIRLPGSHMDLWDGRRDDGSIYEGRFVTPIYASGLKVPLNAIVLSRPPIEFMDFKAEPYLIQPLFGQFSTFHYHLTRDASVSMTVSDPDGNRVRTLLSNVSQTAGHQTIEWDGRADGGKLVLLEGAYTITLTAVDPTSGLSYKWLGVVMVYR